MKHHEVMKTTSEMQSEGLWRCSEPQPSMISCKMKFQRPSSSSSKHWASRWWCVGGCEMRYVFLVDVFFLHFVYFQVLQISCIFHVSPDLFGFPCFFYSHFVPLTCCNQGSDRQEYVLLGRIHGLVRGKDVRIVRYNLEISFEIGVRFCGFAPKKQLETACNLLGLRFGCSLVTRSTQPSVLPCRASCSRKKWTISSLTATRSRGRAIPKNPGKKHKCPKGCGQEEQYRSFR